MTKRKITVGDWGTAKVAYGHAVIATEGGLPITSAEEANAQLIAAAGTSANRLYDQGIDGVKAVEMLPEIVEEIIQLHDDLKKAEMHSLNKRLRHGNHSVDDQLPARRMIKRVEAILTQLQEPSDD